MHACTQWIFPCLCITHIYSELCTAVGSSGDTASVVCGPETTCCTGENEMGSAQVTCCPGPDTPFCGPYHRGAGRLLCLTTRKLITINIPTLNPLHLTLWSLSLFWYFWDISIMSSITKLVDSVCRDGTDMPYICSDTNRSLEISANNTVIGFQRCLTFITECSVTITNALTYMHEKYILIKNHSPIRYIL